MKAVWKATLHDSEPITKVAMPQDSVILCVKAQHGYPCFWFECDPSQPKIEREFHAIASGDPIPKNGKYIGTCHFLAGSYVIHVYEVTHE